MTSKQHVVQEARRTADGTKAASWPGAWAAGVAAALSVVACWFWLLPQLAAERTAQLETGSMASEMAEVAQDDLAGALSTMNLSASAVARLQKGDRDCGARLAWVALSRPSDDATQPVRLRSGTYYSPPFVVTKTPVRVAIPYPAPYESGHGTLTLLGLDDDLAVALSPAWHLPVNTATATHAVTWHPVANCTKP